MEFYFHWINHGIENSVLKAFAPIMMWSSIEGFAALKDNISSVDYRYLSFFSICKFSLT